MSNVPFQWYAMISGVKGNETVRGERGWVKLDSWSNESPPRNLGIYRVTARRLPPSGAQDNSSHGLWQAMLNDGRVRSVEFVLQKAGAVAAHLVFKNVSMTWAPAGRRCNVVGAAPRRSRLP
jgi:hypothetical protein